MLRPEDVGLGTAQDIPTLAENARRTGWPERTLPAEETAAIKGFRRRVFCGGGTKPILFDSG